MINFFTSEKGRVLLRLEMPHFSRNGAFSYYFGSNGAKMAVLADLDTSNAEVLIRIQTIILPVSQSTLTHKLRNSRNNALKIALCLAELHLERLTLPQIAQLVSLETPEEIALAIFNSSL